MTITTKESNLLTMRDDMTEEVKWLVDDTIEFLSERAAELSIKLAGDDRMAQFEAALLRLIVTSSQ